jgi:drug/metabolite transporter (DMT)-like permease
MIWFLLSVLTALAVATQDAWVKKYLSSRSVYDMAAYPMVFSLPLLAAVFPLVPVPPLDRWFLISVAVGIPLNAVCFFLYMRAIKRSPLSLTIPYLAFTPTFMIPTGYFFLNELPDWWGAGGILVTCAGSYVLNIEIGNWSPLSPVKAIWQETGSRLMMTVAFLFSFSAVIGKVGILHSSPLFFSVSFFLTFNLVLVVFLAGLKKIRVRGMWRRRRVGAIAGLLFFLHIIFHGLAIAMTKAAYMIAVKRLSVLISVVYGGMFFQETNLVFRFCGSALMVCGVLMILLMGA